MNAFNILTIDPQEVEVTDVAEDEAEEEAEAVAVAEEVTTEVTRVNKIIIMKEKIIPRRII